MKVELDLSNYATKVNLKNTTGADVASLKSEIDKLDIGKLETTPVDLSKVSDLAKMKLLKRLYMMN